MYSVEQKDCLMVHQEIDHFNYYSIAGKNSLRTVELRFQVAEALFLIAQQLLSSKLGEGGGDSSKGIIG